MTTSRKRDPSLSRQRVVCFSDVRACLLTTSSTSATRSSSTMYSSRARLPSRGLALWVTPDAIVIHEAHASTRMLGTAGKRQYLGSVIRMLAETEPPAKVWLYRIVVFLQHIPIWMFRRSTTLGIRELWRALSGDVGPLPAPTLNDRASV